jgi:hypothetical protein
MIRLFSFPLQARILAVLTAFVLAGLLTAPAQGETPPALAVSSNDRHLVQADGTPFFWLGDTVWELTHKLNREQIDTYLDDRQARGFNVIQTVGLAELGGLTVPNPYGQLPLIGQDPYRPNDAYFEHIDYAIDEAAKRGMYVALLPSWGDKLDKLWGTDPPIFDPAYQDQGLEAAKAKAKAYYRYVGERYADRDNVIFVIGGDRQPTKKQDVWRAMAEGVDEVRDGQLMTFHPLKNFSSSDEFHNDAWLDFNMLQSGQSETEPSYDYIKDDYNKSPIKPTLDAEPRYEGLGNKPVWVRRKAYWGVFAGGFGHTYGHFSLWKIQRESDPNRRNEPTWDEALDAEGGDDMRHLRALMESRPILDRIPDQSLITVTEGTFEDRLQATRDQAGTYAMVYSSNGRTFSVDLSQLAGADAGVTGWWFNPRNGQAEAINGLFSNQDVVQFAPPSSGNDNDWVLVLDAANAGYPTPGGAFVQPKDPVIPEPGSASVLGVLLLALGRRRRRLQG